MSKDDFICVDCPHCGHTNQRSFLTHSVIVCDSCHKTYWSLVDKGFCLTTKLEGKSKTHPDYKKMRSYAEMLSSMVLDEEM